jgi:N-acetylmuramoyl-L-alanine amidase
MIISRKEWGALPPKYSYIKIIPSKVIIHHYGFKTKYAKTKTSESFRGKKTLKRLQNYHMKRCGFIDIGYHYIIGPKGDIYEGRPLGVAGKHCHHNDNSSIGILIYGNFNIEKPNRNQIHCLFHIFKLLNKRYYDLKFPDCIFNHSDLKFTLCPGHHLRNLMNVIKKQKGVLYE